MSDVDVKLSITVVDAAAKKALGDLGTQTDDLGKRGEAAGTKVSNGLKVVSGQAKQTGDAAKGLTGSFGELGTMITDRLGNQGGAALGKLTSFVSVGLVAGVGLAVGAFALLKTALDNTLEAERIQQINNSFNALAESAGLAAGSLRSALIEASRGLVDDEEILNAASRAIVLLDGNASVIPQTMDIARKATALFGGDLIQNFEKINDAIAKGNARALISLGITVDNQKAQQDYAAKIGSTASQLSDLGQKHAVMNAILETGAKRFANVDETSTSATQSQKKLGVAIDEFGEAIVKAGSHSSLFTTVMKTLTGTVDAAADVVNKRFGTGVENAGFKVEQLQGRVIGAEQSVKTLQAAFDSAPGFAKGQFVEGLERSKEGLVSLKIELEDAQKALRMLSATKGYEKPKKPDDDTKKKTPQEIEQEAEAERKAIESEGEFRINALNAQHEAELVNLEAFTQAKRDFLTDTLVQETTLLDEQRASNMIGDEKLFAEKTRLAEKYAVDISKLNEQVAKADKEITKKKQEEEKQRIAGTATALNTIATLQNSNVKELFYIGKAAAIATAYINTATGVTEAFKLGPILGPILAPIVAVAGAAQIATIASQQPAFANGGIVPGTSYAGDNVSARVNSGEMILNDSQQARLFKIANGSGGGSDSAKLDQAIGLMSAILNQPMSVQIDGKEIINVTRSQLSGGRSFT